MEETIPQNRKAYGDEEARLDRVSTRSVTKVK